MLVLLKILGRSIILRGGGGVVSGRVWGGGGPDPKKKGFNRLLIHISNVDG